MYPIVEEENRHHQPQFFISNLSQVTNALLPTAPNSPQVDEIVALPGIF